MGVGGGTPDGPDFRAGVSLELVPDGGLLAGRVGDDGRRRRAAGRPRLRRRGHLHTLRRASRRGDRRRRHRPLPVAPRGVRSRDGRARATPRAGPDWLPARRAARRPRRRGRPGVADPAGRRPGTAPGANRRRRGWRRRERGARDAPGRGVLGIADARRTRSGAAGGPPQSLQGLPRRLRARGMDPASGPGVLRGEEDRPPPRCRRLLARPSGAKDPSRRRHGAPVRGAPSRPGSGPGPPPPSRRRSAPRPGRSGPSRTAAPSSRPHPRHGGPSSSARASSASRSPPL